MVSLSRDQDVALTRIAAWLKGPDPFFVLDGPAGCGKTELAKHVARQTEAIFCSFTGKAANVLRSRGLDATTMHRALYKPKEKGRARLQEMVEQLAHLESRLPAPYADPIHRQIDKLRGEIKQERRRIASPKWEVPEDAPVKDAKLVVVDEYSMLNAQYVNDLHKHAKKVLFLGDPFQLPPIAGDCPLSGRANYTLTTVHRTALDSPILRAVTELRENGRLIDSCKSEIGQWEIVPRKYSSWDEHFAPADITITGFNNTRRTFNKRYRDKLGQKGLMDLEDRIIFLRNDHDLEIYNGTTARVSHFIDDETMMDLVVEMEDGREMAVDAWTGVLQGRDISEAPHREQVVDHAYAITCHKAQGSEYDHVVVWQEPFGKDETMRRRWAYTAATRAKKRCTFVVP